MEDLFDSLTDYFDPSDRRRKRQKVKTYEEEQVRFLNSFSPFNLLNFTKMRLH